MDTTALDTTIDSGPSGLTNDPTPTFTFRADTADSTFECRIDAAMFAACGSTSTFTPALGLLDGEHTFAVRATDPATNTDATPAIRSFTVDTTAPDTTISAGPGETTLLRRPAFAFAPNEPAATFSCSIDSEPFMACSTPLATRELAFGQHTFRVRAPTRSASPTRRPRCGPSRSSSGGNDRLYGGRGRDRIFGEQGNDKLYGERRAGDRLDGAEAREGEGGDRLDGGPGNDQLTDRRGGATLSGGSGADRIDARDDSARDRRTPDTIHCGSGEDSVRADANDRIADDCEHITRKPPPHSSPVGR